MDCQRVGDERLQADKMDVLYGEADAEARSRLEGHLAGCAACREELQALSRLRTDLAGWQLPRQRPARRGVFLPRWLAVAAVLLAAAGLSSGAAGLVSLRRALAAQEARTAALEQRERQARALLEQALRPGGPELAAGLLARVDARVDERLRAGEARQAQAIDARFARLDARLDAQRRVDLARVAEGLSYLDGQHGQQLARTNELMGYVLSQTSQVGQKR